MMGTRCGVGGVAEDVMHRRIGPGGRGRRILPVDKRPQELRSRHLGNDGLAERRRREEE